MKRQDGPLLEQIRTDPQLAQRPAKSFDALTELPIEIQQPAQLVARRPGLDDGLATDQAAVAAKDHLLRLSATNKSFPAGPEVMSDNRRFP